MNTFYLWLCISAVLFQNACGQCIGRPPGVAIAPTLIVGPPEMGIPPCAEQMLPPGPFYGPCGPEMVGPGYPGFILGDPFYGPMYSGNDLIDVDVEADVEASVVEAAGGPLFTAVGFGNDALSLALSPLLEAADADVALLMFTKIKAL